MSGRERERAGKESGEEWGREHTRLRKFVTFPVDCSWLAGVCDIIGRDCKGIGRIAGGGALGAVGASRARHCTIDLNSLRRWAAERQRSGGTALAWLQPSARISKASE